MKTIYVIGIGMGNPQTITCEGLEIIQKSQAVIGAKRMVDSFTGISGKKDYSIKPDEILSWIGANDSLDTIAVLMSGDVGFYSGAKKLKSLVGDGYQLEMIPGISSLQYLCAKIQIPWQDVKTVSLHGRTGNFLGEVQTHKQTFLLTDRKHDPAYICKELTDHGLGHTSVIVGQQLSYDEEQILSGRAEELQNKSFDPLSVVMVENPSPATIRPDTEDRQFIREKVPMTKEEVRSVSLSKLQVEEDDRIYDVGAGTGSVSVAMAQRAVKGQVYAIETEEKALSLIEKNKQAFQLSNLHIIGGMAPRALRGLPIPDKAFIGGSKGNMDEILRTLKNRNPKIRIVINVIALESIAASLESLKNCGFDLLDVVQVSVAKAKELGNYHMMMGQNPVFVITAEGKDGI